MEIRGALANQTLRKDGYSNVASEEVSNKKKKTTLIPHITANRFCAEKGDIR
jgi:hypothetical protein